MALHITLQWQSITSVFIISKTVYFWQTSKIISPHKDSKILPTPLKPIQDLPVLFCDSRGCFSLVSRTLRANPLIVSSRALFLAADADGWWFGRRRLLVLQSSVRVTNGNFPFVWRIFTSHSFIHEEDLGLVLSLLLAGWLAGWLADWPRPTTDRRDSLCVIFISPQIQSVVVTLVVGCCWWIGDCGEKSLLDQIQIHRRRRRRWWWQQCAVEVSASARAGLVSCRNLRTITA